MMLRRFLLAALIALSPSLALAQVNSPDFSIAAYVRNALAGNVVIGGNLTVGGIIIDTSGGITVGSPTGGSQGTGTINVAVNYFKNGIATPSTVSLPLALAAGNISCPTCVLISGTAHGDSAYAILSTDRYVYTNAAFTAARIWTLPAANSLAAGTTIWVQDAQGTVTTTNTLTIQRAGADTVNVSGTNVVMTGAGGGTQFTTDGVSNWGTAVQTVTTGGTGRQTLTNHGVIVGAATNPVTQLAVGSNGQLLLGATGADPAFGTMSQDCTITAAGVITCTKTNNVAFVASATTDTTNAANISTGTLAAARGGAGTITGALKGNGAGLVSQAACADLSNGTTNCSAAVGQLPGETSTGNASAGNVGEHVSSVIAFASRITLTTGTAANVTSISLTAGDWEVSGSVAFSTDATTNVTAIIGGVSTTTATLDQTTAERFNQLPILAAGQVLGAITSSTPLSATRISLSSTTTVFLVAFSTFTVANNKAWGTIRARRAR